MRLRGSRNTHYGSIDSSGGGTDFGLFLPRFVVHSRRAHRKFWGVTHPTQGASQDSLAFARNDGHAVMTGTGLCYALNTAREVYAIIAGGC